MKLPSADELFSDGPHLATRSFEIGSTALDREVAMSLDSTLEMGRFGDRHLELELGSDYARAALVDPDRPLPGRNIRLTYRVACSGVICHNGGFPDRLTRNPDYLRLFAAQVTSSRGFPRPGRRDTPDVHVRGGGVRAPGARRAPAGRSTQARGRTGVTRPRDVVVSESAQGTRR